MSNTYNDHSESSRPRYYITTAIDYPNAPPHIGHSLEKVAADVIARYHRLLGHDTYFSIGLDENSQHVLKAANAQHVDPIVWIDRMDEAFRLAWSKLEIGQDYWIHTTEKRHVRASQEMFRRAQENGDIYKAIYSGWYCTNCNTFYNDDELVAGKCPNHPSLSPEWLEEENYFFALSKYRDQLLDHIDAHPEFIVPAIRRAEIVSLLRQGLRDFSVSRLVRPGAPAWGIPHKRELKGKSPREFSRVNRRRWSPLGGQPSSCGAGLMGANAWTASQIALQIWGTDPHALG